MPDEKDDTAGFLGSRRRLPLWLSRGMEMRLGCNADVMRCATGHLAVWFEVMLASSVDMSNRYCERSQALAQKWTVRSSPPSMVEKHRHSPGPFPGSASL